VTDPYTGREILVVPPIRPDWAVIHALRADVSGNVVCSAMESDRLAVLAADRSVVTVEEVVPAGALLARPGEIFLSALHIDLVVSAPLGAHPAGCVNLYGVDRAHMERYMALSKTAEGFRSYLEEFVLGMTEEEYRERVALPSGVRRVAGAAGKEA
jgi:glutaconate CoA-transferase subunit A